MPVCLEAFTYRPVSNELEYGKLGGPASRTLPDVPVMVAVVMVSALAARAVDILDSLDTTGLRSKSKEELLVGVGRHCIATALPRAGPSALPTHCTAQCTQALSGTDHTQISVGGMRVDVLFIMGRQGRMMHF